MLYPFHLTGDAFATSPLLFLFFMKKSVAHGFSQVIINGIRISQRFLNRLGSRQHLLQRFSIPLCYRVSVRPYRCPGCIDMPGLKGFVTICVKISEIHLYANDKGAACIILYQRLLRLLCCRCFQNLKRFLHML